MMRHEVENAVAKAKYVWWDMESCSVPDGCNPNEIRWNIESALVKCYGPGPLTIFAIGNSRRVPPHVLEAMSRSGIIINHTHIGGHSVATNLCSWVSNHSPPAILLLISDRESAFQNLLVRYEALGYTIARAYLNPPPESLKYNCNVWLWKSLLTQEETTRQELHGKWKCNETVWRCRLCFIDGQGFEDFTSHLDSGEHALKEFLLLPHSDFMEEPYKGGLPDLRLLKEMKFPDPKNLRIGWDVRRKEKKAGVLPNKGGEDALKDPVKQALLIKWEKQYKAGMLPHKGGKDALKDPVKQESDMVSPDCAAGHNEKDASLDFVKNQSKAGTLPNKGGEDAPKDLSSRSCPWQ